jgi:HK97 family phage prohead protease
MSVRIEDFKSLVPKEFRAAVEGHAIELAYAAKDGIDRDGRSVPFIASDDSVDHDDEIIAAGAFHELRGIYARNPVLLTQHNYSTRDGASPVIGSVRDLRTGENPFKAIAEFAEPPADKHHWPLYRDGHQRAFSVGFVVKDTAKRDGRRVITRGLLLEISAVPIPANSNALVTNHLINQVGRVAEAGADAGEARELHAALAELRKDLDTLLGRSSGGDEENTKDADDDEELCEMLAATADALKGSGGQAA